jgi:tetratricopeptide (TPR) repeat protein
MNRFLYFAGFAYIALCGAVVARRLSSLDRRVVTADTAVHVAPLPRPVLPTTSGGRWFAAMKPYCNQVEVDVRERFSPPPGTTEGAGYAAACFALAGKIDRARSAIEALPGGLRPRAATIVFNVGHPVADAGDDASAGPIMRLVVEYTPENYMALYHAGVSEYMLGQYDYARTHLERFLQLYQPEDGWRANARELLGRIR